VSGWLLIDGALTAPNGALMRRLRYRDVPPTSNGALHASRFFSGIAKDTLRIIHDGNGKLPARPAMSEADIVGVLRAVLQSTQRTSSGTGVHTTKEFVHAH
jgi:hypothetical protein